MEATVRRVEVVCCVLSGQQAMSRDCEGCQCFTQGWKGQGEEASTVPLCIPLKQHTQPPFFSPFSPFPFSHYEEVNSMAKGKGGAQCHSTPLKQQAQPPLFLPSRILIMKAKLKVWFLVMAI